MTEASLWQQGLAQMPLMAILRGIRPEEVLDVATALQKAGFLWLEIPLNSPDPLIGIRRMRERFDGALLIGAGTVLTPAEVEAVHEAGAQFVVSPNTNPAVIRATKALGLLSSPGFATPTEAFTALEAGADALKLFPGEATPPSALRAMKVVLPSKVPVFVVGGVTPVTMADYVAAGAAGFGMASSVYKAGDSPGAVYERAQAFVGAWRGVRR